MNRPISRELINQQMAQLLDGGELTRAAKSPVAESPEAAPPVAHDPAQNPPPLALSFIFFSDVNQAMDHRYQLVFELSAFADQNGFTAVWLPERHFHPFGGIYPDPAVLAAALAVQTQHIRFRSGSVVLPLHHPAAVVESWSMVDHLSGGRVDLGFASGWNPNDFILSPDTFADHRQIWFDRIPQVEKLWRGEAMTFINGKGEATEITVHPKPLQAELNVWLVVSKTDEGFQYAGAKGYNLLTMLQGIDLDTLAAKIKLYRDARQANGFDPATGIVTLMMHTLIHQDIDVVRAAVREPFFAYIKSAMKGHLQAMQVDKPLTDAEINKTVEYSYERYFTTGALFGSVSDAQRVANKAIAVGVNEIACLMDFGVDYHVVKDSLPYLQAFKEVMIKAKVG